MLQKKVHEGFSEFVNTFTSTVTKALGGVTKDQLQECPLFFADHIVNSYASHHVKIILERDRKVNECFMTLRRILWLNSLEQIEVEINESKKDEKAQD